MSYGLIYTVPFATLDNIPCAVEIEKGGYIGEVTELIAGDTPFTVDIDSEEFLYTPARFSTAKLQVVGNDYLQALFSTEYRQYRVTLKKDGVVSWCGFIKPELYTQDYTAETFILEIECFSAMSVLEFIDYTTEGAGKAFISIWSLLKRCIETSYGKYNTVYTPYVYAKTKADYEAEINVIESMMISEQNFFDEDNKPMKLSEVLEEICKFLNWTCVDWKGELYFVDVDHAGTYHRYDVSLTTKVDGAINTLTVQDISFAGSDHSLDILPGFNKVTVKCSNYHIGDLVNFETDYSKLNQIHKLEDVVSDNKVSHRVIMSPEGLSMKQYKLNDDGENFTEVDEVDRDNANALYGSLPMRYCNYNMVENNGTWNPDITDYSYTDVIRTRILSNPSQEHKYDYFRKLEAIRVTGASASYTDGVICIDGEVRLFVDSELSFIEFNKNLLSNSFRYSLRIGDKYYTEKKGWKASEWDRGELVVGETDGAGFAKINNHKTLSFPYPGAKGYIIPLNEKLYGELELIIYTDFTMDYYDERSVGFAWKDFQVKYVPHENMKVTSDNSDRTYENVLNENYINELDEIELKISSYNNDGACYSKVMLDGDYLKDNLYNVLLDKTKRPEELLITRIINHYSATRIKLTQVIKNSDEISPLTILSDTFLVNKRFINAGGSIDYKMNRFECIMIEI